MARHKAEEEKNEAAQLERREQKLATNFSGDTDTVLLSSLIGTEGRANPTTGAEKFNRLATSRSEDEPDPQI